MKLLSVGPTWCSPCINETTVINRAYTSITYELVNTQDMGPLFMFKLIVVVVHYNR